MIECDFHQLRSKLALFSAPVYDLPKALIPTGQWARGAWLLCLVGGHGSFLTCAREEAMVGSSFGSVLSGGCCLPVGPSHHLLLPGIMQWSPTWSCLFQPVLLLQTE